MKYPKFVKKIFIFIMTMIFINFVRYHLYAAGEGNVDGGGSGNMGQGTHENQWIPGDEGVRVTVVNAETGRTEFDPIDISRKSHIGKRIHHIKI